MTVGDFDRAVRVSPHNFGDSNGLRARNNSHVVTLEGIYVRKPERPVQPISHEKHHARVAGNLSPQRGGRRFASVQPKERLGNSYTQPDEAVSSPVATKLLNLSAIPNAIKVEGILQSAHDVALAPPSKRR